MDRLIIERKLESLRRCLVRVEQKRPESVAALASDADTQDILVLNLTRAVQLCVDIATHVIIDLHVNAPETMGETFVCLAESGIIDAALAARLKNAVGFRNVAVHAYDTIDWGIVFAIATSHQDDFKAFARAMSETLTQ